MVWKKAQAKEVALKRGETTPHRNATTRSHTLGRASGGAVPRDESILRHSLKRLTRVCVQDTADLLYLEYSWEECSRASFSLHRPALSRAVKPSGSAAIVYTRQGMRKIVCVNRRSFLRSLCSSLFFSPSSFLSFLRSPSSSLHPPSLLNQQPPHCSVLHSRSLPTISSVFFRLPDTVILCRAGKCAPRRGSGSTSCSPS